MLDNKKIENFLFKNSSFFYLKKDENTADVYKNEISSLSYDAKVMTFQLKRRDEFLLGRLCASKAHQEHFGTPLNRLDMDEARAPVWPSGVIGSISHNSQYIGAVVASNAQLLGLGIDFESFGRMKEGMKRTLVTHEDLTSHQSFSDMELLTFIFSAKESLYKALYPSVNKYFGFKAAAIKEIDFFKGSFKINLIEDLDTIFGPAGKYNSFEGRFIIMNKTVLTSLEIFR